MISLVVRHDCYLLLYIIQAFITEKYIYINNAYSVARTRRCFHCACERQCVGGGCKIDDSSVWIGSASFVVDQSRHTSSEDVVESVSLRSLDSESQRSQRWRLCWFLSTDLDGRMAISTLSWLLLLLLLWWWWWPQRHHWRMLTTAKNRKGDGEERGSGVVLPVVAAVMVSCIDSWTRCWFRFRLTVPIKIHNDNSTTMDIPADIHTIVTGDNLGDVGSGSRMASPLPLSSSSSLPVKYGLV